MNFFKSGWFGFGSIILVVGVFIASSAIQSSLLALLLASAVFYLMLLVYIFITDQRRENRLTFIIAVLAYIKTLSRFFGQGEVYDFLMFLVEKFSIVLVILGIILVIYSGIKTRLSKQSSQGHSTPRQ